MVCESSFGIPISLFFLVRIISFRVLIVRVTDRADSTMALDKAKQIVAYNPVAVFSKSYCPYCVEVKNLLANLGASFKAVELDAESDGSQVQAALAQWTGQRTVPNVFIGGKHSGGCDATVAVNDKGGLIPLLTEAGAIAKVSAFF